jgi:hypothetical protein
VQTEIALAPLAQYRAAARLSKSCAVIDPAHHSSFCCSPFISRLAFLNTSGATRGI